MTQKLMFESSPDTEAKVRTADELWRIWQDIPATERLRFLEKVRLEFLSRPKSGSEPAATTHRRRRPSRTPQAEARP